MNNETIKLDITGMTCDHCATGIENLLSKNEGVTAAKVSYPKATCECSFDPSKTSKDEIINTINSTKNYKVLPLLNPPLWGGLDTTPDYHTANPLTYGLMKEKAKQMKKNPTQAETIAWELLRANRLGFHIRRQHIIGNFVVDFVHIKTKTILEIDGKIHDYQKAEDGQRTNWLNQQGFEVLRFSNEKVMSDPDGFCNEVKSILSQREFKLDIDTSVNHTVKVLPIGEDLGGAFSSPNGGGREGAFDLIIIGGGSAAFSAAIKAESLGLKTLMVNAGLDFGGTCVNVGCVPSKNLIRAGEAAYHATHSNFTGIKPKGVDIDFAQIIKDKKKLVATLQQKKYMDVVSDFENLTMLKGWARFKDDKTIEIFDDWTCSSTIGEARLRDNPSPLGRLGGAFLIATGATTRIPNIEGLDQVEYLTNVSLFDLEKQPKSLIVLGGGYIALEIAQAYQRLGTRVTLLQRSEHVLSHLTSDISDELLKQMRDEGIAAHTGIQFQRVTQKNETIRVAAIQDGVEQIYEAEKLVVATGTKPNTQKLGLQNIGLKLDKTGHVLVNERMETNLPHIFAAGDCANTPAFVYTAALEGKTAVETAFTPLLGGPGGGLDYSSLPWVVFTDPQVAGTGLDEAQAEALNIPFEVSKLELKDVPRAIAANDTRGFIKLIRNTETDKLIGARVVAPEGGELIQQLSMAIKYGITVKDLADSFYPYLTLGEGIKLAAITFGKDVSKLSCCAS